MLSLSVHKLRKSLSTFVFLLVLVLPSTAWLQPIASDVLSDYLPPAPEGWQRMQILGFSDFEWTDEAGNLSSASRIYYPAGGTLQDGPTVVVMITSTTETIDPSTFDSDQLPFNLDQLSSILSLTGLPEQIEDLGCPVSTQPVSVNGKPGFEAMADCPENDFFVLTIPLTSENDQTIVVSALSNSDTTTTHAFVERIDFDALHQLIDY